MVAVLLSVLQAPHIHLSDQHNYQPLCFREKGSTARKVVVFLITTEKWVYFWLETGVPLRVQFSGQFCHISIGGVECTASKFAGGTRLGGAFDSFEGQDALQRDVDTLEH